MKKNCDRLLKTNHKIEIVSGCARGADSLGEKYATEKNYKLHKFPADWDRFGKSAGYRRNQEMAEFADMVIAFWDGKSVGTKHMIDISKSKNKPCQIIDIS